MPPTHDPSDPDDTWPLTPGPTDHSASRDRGPGAGLFHDQRRRWRAGERVLVEDYLDRSPALHERPEIILALIRAEIELREEVGDVPLPEEYLARFPDLRRGLEELFAARSGPDAVLFASTKTHGTGNPHTDEPVADPPSPIPERIGRYPVRGEIGRGGFGVVYRGRDEALDREVAIKVPHPHRMTTPADAAAFLAEARILAQLDHTCIVPVYDFGPMGANGCFLVSKFVPGGSLADRLRAGPVPLAESAALVATAAAALHHAHGRGLVHRDIKPGNILLEADGRPVVADFGLALREEDSGRGPTHAGTLAYMSPEQARGEGHLVDARTDVYGLGAVLYELLTGQRPFRATDRGALRALVLRGEPRPPRQLNDAIPRELDRICLKALSKRAADRYSTALDLEEDLRRWLADPRPVTVVLPLPDPPPPSDGPPPTTDGDRPPVVPRGLRSFEADDADFFLPLLPGPRGRGGLPESVRFWKSLLDQTDDDRTFRVGLVYGPSGCGKSSLMKAGVLPRLANHVAAVYVEATADDTEARVLAGVRKRWPALPPGLTLADALARVRRDRRTGASKLVVVIDQFEQWLHAHPGETGGDLVAALRQCDGGAVQAVLLVRDDFWMGVSRFMRELEIPLLEGRNSAPADLFDPRHARKVLLAFGRAYGALPEGKPTPEQERFLDLAVTGLAEGGRVIPVRLALFAEMVKGKPWTPVTWRDTGGAEGVGVAFLEETFGPTGPPHHRPHRDAARGVLARLLPEPGADLKGPMRSRAELMAASGYAARPREFDELLRVLDGELRLVTATDHAATDGAPAEPGARYYQLTHDYLVPAVRQWLTRQQRATRRGRAELLLAERAGVWAARPEPRHLPSWWEWVRCRLLTRPREWTRPQRAMMRRAARHHARRGLVLAAVLGLLVFGGGEYQARARADALRDNLLTADIADVPKIVDEMEPHRRRVDPLLRAAHAEAEASGNAPRRLKLSLALLPSDPGQLDYLYERLLTALPEEFVVVRDRLEPHRGEFAERLWAELGDRTRDLNRRFRAAGALAAYAPADPRWDEYRELVAEKLVTENALVVGRWARALEPVGERLLPPLAALLADDTRGSTERRTSAQLYRAFAAGRPTAFAPLEALLEEGTPAKKRANVAAALLAMDRPERVWALFVHRPDPTVRSYLIEQVATAGVEPAVLERQLAALDAETGEPATSTRRALILALGAFPPDQPPTATPHLLHLYEHDPDPGVHGAAEWALRKWGHADAVTAVNRRLATGKLEGSRRWYVNAERQTFTCVGPDRLEVGPRVVVVNYRFAVATKEVTVAEFQRFRKQKYSTDVSNAPDCPMNSVRWDDAAEYCNYLSWCDGLPEAQWCYVRRQDGERGPDFAPAPDWKARTGYRLPTEAEWELAARAGAVTPFACGNAGDDLLVAYAWYDRNSYSPDQRSWPVGLLKPSDLGLFDAHGNLLEWCHEVQPPTKRPGLIPSPNDPPDTGLGIVRGGSLFGRAPDISIDWRIPVSLAADARSNGFRPVRRLP